MQQQKMNQFNFATNIYFYKPCPWLTMNQTVKFEQNKTCIKNIEWLNVDLEKFAFKN